MKEKNIYKIFWVSLAFKGAQALLEVVAGIFLYFVTASSVSIFIQGLLETELTEDPGDKLFNYFYNTVQNFSNADKSFLVFYLLSHGLVKAILVGGIFKNKAWAYPSFILIQIFFIVYQISASIHRHALILTVITVFDMGILWLVWHEYKLKKKHHVLS